MSPAPEIGSLDQWRLRDNRGTLIVFQQGHGSTPIVHQVDCRSARVTPNNPVQDTRIYDYLPTLYAVEVVLRRQGMHRLIFCGLCITERVKP